MGDYADEDGDYYDHDSDDSESRRELEEALYSQIYFQPHEGSKTGSDSTINLDFASDVILSTSSIVAANSPQPADQETHENSKPNSPKSSKIQIKQYVSEKISSKKTLSLHGDSASYSSSLFGIQDTIEIDSDSETTQPNSYVNSRATSVADSAEWENLDDGTDDVLIQSANKKSKKKHKERKRKRIKDSNHIIILDQDDKDSISKASSIQNEDNVITSDKEITKKTLRVNNSFIEEENQNVISISSNSEVEDLTPKRKQRKVKNILDVDLKDNNSRKNHERVTVSIEQNSKSKATKRKIIPHIAQSDSDADSLSDLDTDFFPVDISLNVKGRNSTNQSTYGLDTILESLEECDWSVIRQDRVKDSMFSRGRYYQSPKNMLCMNCNERGHLSKVCPKPKKEAACIWCGARGHTTRTCEQRHCNNCHAPGHASVTCPFPARSRHYTCRVCQCQGHGHQECPNIWRQFHLTTSLDKAETSKMKSQESKRKHCSNCSKPGHFDFECTREKMDFWMKAIYPYIPEYDLAREYARVEHAAHAQHPPPEVPHPATAHGHKRVWMEAIANDVDLLKEDQPQKKRRKKQKEKKKKKITDWPDPNRHRKSPVDYDDGSQIKGPKRHLKKMKKSLKETFMRLGVDMNLRKKLKGKQSGQSTSKQQDYVALSHRTEKKKSSKKKKNKNIKAPQDNYGPTQTRGFNKRKQ